MWAGVTERFRTFHRNLDLTDDQISEGADHHAGVRKALNRHYYGVSDLDNSFLIGSWDKYTRTRPPRDIDLYFVLPYNVYQRFESVQGNKQSALLQEIKRVLQNTYPNTGLRGDGQVVVVDFYRMSVEVVPAFALRDSQQYWICDTHNGGRYKTADPRAESSNIASVNSSCNNNLRPLIMMMKAWQSHCNVPIKSFWIELVSAEFLQQSRWNQMGYYYYDWIMRDFFAYLYHRANQYVCIPGTGELIALGDEWQSRSETAYHRAVNACEYEKADYVHAAGEEWQKIFGKQIPWSV